MPGVRIRHRFHRGNLLYLVPLLAKPIKGRHCPLCQTEHGCKTIHLELRDGAAIVSTGVLADLQSAGMPDLDIVGEVVAPPTLRAGSMSRVRQDQRNERITQWSKM